MLSLAITARLKKSEAKCLQKVICLTRASDSSHVLYSKINGFMCRACSLTKASAVMHGYIHLDSAIVDQTVSKIMKAY